MLHSTKVIETVINSLKKIKVKKIILDPVMVAKGGTKLVDDKSIEIGTPNVGGAKVEADLIKNSKNRTILIFKKRRRQNSRRKNGHRQEYSMIRINKIFSKDGKVLSEAEKVSKKPKKEETKEAVSK